MKEMKDQRFKGLLFQNLQNNWKQQSGRCKDREEKSWNEQQQIKSWNYKKMVTRGNGEEPRPEGRLKKEGVWGFTGGKNRAVWNRSQEEREKNPRLYIYFKKSLCIYQAQKELWVAVKQGNMH